jgi:outer membrane protein OmpA-like peptidoglycan-associated protein
MSALKGLLVAGAALVAGCAATPEATHSLDSARSTYRMAATDPEVQLRAPVELQVAERALAEAERHWKEGADPAVVSHHAYLAEQRARIAMKTADYRQAEAAVATSSEQRNRILLEARERELEAQRRQTELAREQAMVQKRAAEEQQGQLAAEMQRLQSEISELKTAETDRGWVLTLANDMLFDSGRAVLKPGGQKAVENLAQFMRKEPERGITIEGFTDSTGSEEVNRKLSELRAQAVKEALVARGIEAKRIETRGYGPAFPVASNDTAVGRQLNRRVQVVIAGPGKASAGGSAR